jgi:hypothetical protein
VNSFSFKLHRVITYQYHHFRAAFEDKPLIFASFSKDAKKTWIKKSHAIWTGYPSIKSKAALADSYSSLQKLFQDRIGITAAGPEVLVDELIALENRWRWEAITPTVNEHVSALLVDIAKVMSKTEPYESSPKWLRKLTDAAIFPVKSPCLGLITCRSNEDFYIPDSSGRYQEVFCNDVPLLSLAAPPMIHYIKPVLNSPFFEPRLKYLTHAVTRVARPNGPRLRNDHIKDKYVSKLNFIKRCVTKIIRNITDIDSRSIGWLPVILVLHTKRWRSLTILNLSISSP